MVVQLAAALDLGLGRPTPLPRLVIAGDEQWAEQGLYWRYAVLSGSGGKVNATGFFREWWSRLINGRELLNAIDFNGRE